MFLCVQECSYWLFLLLVKGLLVYSPQSPGLHTCTCIHKTMTDMPEVTILCLWYCIWYSVSVEGKAFISGFAWPSACLDIRCAFQTLLCEEFRLRARAYMRGERPHARFLSSKRGKQEIMTTFLISSRLPPHEGPTINIHFLVFFGKNRMFVVCCNWPSLKRKWWGMKKGTQRTPQICFH